MGKEQFIAVAIVGVHMLAVFWARTPGGSRQGVMWLVRIGVTLFTGITVAWLLEGLRVGLPPQVVIISLLSLIAMGAIWLTPTRGIVWGLFLLQCVALTALAYFLFVYQVTKTF